MPMNRSDQRLEQLIRAVLELEDLDSGSQAATQGNNGAVGTSNHWPATSPGRLAVPSAGPLPAPTDAARRGRHPAPAWGRTRPARAACIAAAGLAACTCWLLWSTRPHGAYPAGRPEPAPRVMATPLHECRSCDANGDHCVDARDIDAFLLAMLRPEEYEVDYPHCDALCTSDMNGDGRVDVRDVDPFLSCLALALGR